MVGAVLIQGVVQERLSRYVQWVKSRIDDETVDSERDERYSRSLAQILGD